MTTELPTCGAGAKGTMFMGSDHCHDKDPLHCFFSPTSVGVIGATDRAGSVGNTVLRNVLSGYKGRVYPVNPSRSEVCGVPCYASIGAVPEAVTENDAVRPG